MDYKQKSQQIKKLLKQYENAPKQGTLEWLQQRTGIGGSEMAIITGDNKYSNIKNLISLHTGLSEFKGNSYTRWGSLFEEQIRLLVELLMQCKIHEIGSIDGCIPNHRYSPDGLATMELLVGTDNTVKDQTNMYHILTEKTPKYDSLDIVRNYINLLLEFKCPHSRIPTGTIPKEYLAQVKSGLCDLPCCTDALFVDACFRRCAYKDWKFTNQYNTDYHKSDGAISKKKTCICDFQYTISIRWNRCIYSSCRYNQTDIYPKTRNPRIRIIPKK